MIEFYSPCEEDIHTLQNQESAFYWSGCADMLFRKHGFLNCIKRPRSAAPKGVPVLLRGAQPTWSLGSPFLAEGPLSDSLLSALNLSAEVRFCESFSCYDKNKKMLGQLLYSKFLVKRIPGSRDEKTEAHPYSDQHLFWNNNTIKVQVFKPSGIWYPAFFARLEGDESPLEVIGVTDGKRLILGAPIFDVILYNHSMPALDEGFYTTVKGTYLFKLEQWLVQKVCEIAALSNITLKRHEIWPEGCQAGLTIRHDYDRPISDGRLEEILTFYRQRSIKATWFLLVDKPPSSIQINRMIEEGHEVALHSIAPYFEDFRLEVKRFQELTGVFPLGYSCHGGIGSRGQLALTQHLWSENLGLLYGEMIGRSRGLPHPVLKPDCGAPISGRLILHNSHNSLDLGMKPEAHQLDYLTKELPMRLSEGGHVILMNHPDIHWSELQILIDRLNLSNVWHCTLEEAARWARASRFAFNGYSEDEIEYSFPTDLKNKGRLIALLQPKLSPIALDENPLTSQVIPRLKQEINVWYNQEAPHATPASKAASIQSNTIDLPRRLNHLLRPLKDTLDLTQSFNLLDVGCGYGGIPIFLAQTYPHAQVTAIDTSDRFFRVGQRTAQGLDLENLSFQTKNILDVTDKEGYDIIIASNVINFLTTPQDLEHACSNLMQALKPGGWAVIHTPHFWSFIEPFTKIPLLQLLPIHIREKVSRFFKKRSSFQDIRLPSFYELQRFLRKHGGQIRHNTHKSFLRQLMSTHFTVWVEKK